MHGTTGFPLPLRSFVAHFTWAQYLPASDKLTVVVSSHLQGRISLFVSASVLLRSVGYMAQGVSSSNMLDPVGPSLCASMDVAVGSRMLGIESVFVIAGMLLQCVECIARGSCPIPCRLLLGGFCEPVRFLPLVRGCSEPPARCVCVVIFLLVWALPKDLFRAAVSARVCW